MYKNQKELRKAFKEVCPDYRIGKKHNDQSTTVRTIFSMWLDALAKAGVVSEKLANKATLGG